MKILQVITVWLAIVGIGSSASAGDLLESVAKAVEKEEQTTRPAADQRPMPRVYLWSGAALFAGGMAVAMSGFLNNRNGEFPEFGEADSTNIAMGAAGLAAAVGGGMVLFLGKKRVGRVSSVVAVPGRVSAAAKFVW